MKINEVGYGLCNIALVWYCITSKENYLKITSTCFNVNSDNLVVHL